MAAQRAAEQQVERQPSCCSVWLRLFCVVLERGLPSCNVCTIARPRTRTRTRTKEKKRNNKTESKSVGAPCLLLWFCVSCSCLPVSWPSVVYTVGPRRASPCHSVRLWYITSLLLLLSLCVSPFLARSNPFIVHLRYTRRFDPHPQPPFPLLGSSPLHTYIFSSLFLFFTCATCGPCPPPPPPPPPRCC